MSLSNGVYLVCSCCGATLDARRKNIGTENERISGDREELRQRARQLGWVGEMSWDSEDLCPNCADISLDNNKNV